MAIIDRYRLIRGLGRGGFGAVFEAVDALTGERVALKVRLREAGRSFRFRQEYLILSMLDHLALPAVYRLGSHEGRLWLAQEYIDGLSPGMYVRGGGPAGSPGRLARTLRVLAAICEGLSALHGAGVVHCDLKSGNVLVEPGGQARILDLGGAKVLEEDIPIGEGVAGTWSYAPPELLRRGPITARIDLYALGVMAYRLLTGGRPYAGETREAVLAAMETPLVGPVPGVSADISALVMSLLSLDAAERPESAAATRQALLACGATEPILLPEPPRWQREARDRGRKRIDAALPGSALRIGGAEKAAVIDGLVADAAALSAVPLSGGIGPAAQQAAALLDADPPGVSRARLLEADLSGGVPRDLEHAALATLLALAASGPVVISGAPEPRMDQALRGWARKKRAPVVLLLADDDGAEVTAEAPRPRASAEDTAAVTAGDALSGAGRLSEATAVIGAALLKAESPALWLAMARVHLWLHQPGAARAALARSGRDPTLAAERREVAATLALLRGRRGEALALLAAAEGFWVSVHRALASPGHDPTAEIDVEALAAPEHTMLRLALRQAEVDFALRSGDQDRALSALRQARGICRAVQGQLTEADAMAWRLRCEIGGLM